jgi:hypothetical protein
MSTSDGLQQPPRIWARVRTLLVLVKQLRQEMHFGAGRV